MPSLYTEHSEKWKSLADIDYFTQFVKAWIPFNAWYKTYYPGIDSDRAAVDEIKATSNKIHDKLLSLLQGSDTESITFKSHIARLHTELGRKYIYNKYGERICFDIIVVERNSKRVEEFTSNRMTYRVERGPGGRTEKEIETTITANGVVRFSHTQTSGHNLEELRALPAFAKLSAAQQASLASCYTQVDPRKQSILLTKDGANCIEMGGIKFVNDPEQLCKGILEILYSLRNALFHGEIIPDKDTNKAYEPAYHILNSLVQAL